MSLYPCSSCGQRTKGRLATAYIAWFKADGARTCYKMRLCFDCVLRNIAPLNKALREADTTSLTWCPICKSEVVGSDLDPTYVTMYLPKSEGQEFAYQMHAACAAKFRGPVTQDGILQPDRGVILGPQDSSPTQDWSQVV